MRRILIALAASCFSQVAMAGELPCMEAKAKGSYLYSDMEQVGASKKLYACVEKNLICMLTQKGKIIESNDFSGIRKRNDKIIFGVVQVLKGKNAPYCAYGSFIDDEMSGAAWLYRLDNYRGNFGGDSTAEQNTPLRPSKFLDVLDELNKKAP